MKIYIAGPMRGHPLYNFPKFFKAAMALREAGYEVFNPAERDMAIGFDPALPLDHETNEAVFSLPSAFEWDFEAIKKADAIALLPGWRESGGVQAELVLAHMLGRETYEIADGILKSLDIKSYKVEFSA